MLLFVLFVISHYMILMSFFVEVVTPFSINIFVAAAMTLAFVGLFGVLKGRLTTPTTDGVFYGSASVAAVSIVLTGLLFGWALAHPVSAPAPLGGYLALTIAENAIWVVIPIVTVPATAFAGVYLGRRLGGNARQKNANKGRPQQGNATNA